MPISTSNRSAIQQHGTQQQSALLQLPLDVMFEITKHMGLADLSRLQKTCSLFYVFIMDETRFTYFNTVKLFELFYQHRLIALFLFQHANPRYSYTGCPLLIAPDESPEVADRMRSQRQELLGNTAFHIAAANGHIDVVQFYLEREKKALKRFPPCEGSVYNTEALEYLTLKPENVECPLYNVINDEPNTVLHYISIMPESCSEDSMLTVARMLMRAGCDFHKAGRAGNTVLAEASQHGQLKVVRLVLSEAKRMFELNARKFQRSRNFIQTHSRSNNAVTGMMTSPANQDGGEEKVPVFSAGNTPRSVNRSLYTINEDEIKLKVHTDLKALINLSNNYEENALILAARAHPDIVKLLLSTGADPNSSRRGNPLIHIVCSQFRLDQHELSHFTSYHASRTDGLFGRNMVSLTSPRTMVNPNGNIELEPESNPIDTNNLLHTLRYLLAHGADVHAVQTGTGMKPLHTAAFWGNTDAAEVIMRLRNVDPNSEVNTVNRWLPIHYACIEGKVAVIQCLAKHGARVWDTDEVPTDADDNMDLNDQSPEQYLFAQTPAPLALLSVETLKSTFKALNKSRRISLMSTGHSRSQSQPNFNVFR